MSEHHTHPNTNRFIATFGTLPGYKRPGNPWPMSVFVREWNAIVSKTEPIVSATITNSTVSYPLEGEMVSEPIFTVMGVRNPYYCEDSYMWQRSVLIAVDAMRGLLKQTTSQVVFDHVEAHYFRED